MSHRGTPDTSDGALQGSGGVTEDLRSFLEKRAPRFGAEEATT
jgi:hypothetical protein